MTDKSAWAFYLVGALGVLLIKYANWIKTGKKNGKKWWPSTKEWLSISLLEEKASWLTTIGIVWIAGAVFIDKVSVSTGVIWLDKALAIPVFDAAAFTLGTLMEYLAPEAAKRILNKIKTTP